MRIRANNPIPASRRKHRPPTEYVPTYTIPEPFTEEWYAMIGRGIQRASDENKKLCDGLMEIIKGWNTK